MEFDLGYAGIDDFGRNAFGVGVSCLDLLTVLPGIFGTIVAYAGHVSAFPDGYGYPDGKLVFLVGDGVEVESYRHSDCVCLGFQTQI